VKALVIFDCDGVLVDSEPISNRVLAETLTEYGLPTTTEESIRTYMGRTMASCLAIAADKLGRPLPEDFMRAFRDRSFAALAREVEPVPGIHGVLAHLRRAQTPHCLASSGPHEKIRLTLGQSGLLEHFEGRIFSAVDVARGKPHPDVFLHAAEQMGVAPGSCAVVEDSPFGVEAAVAAGMQVFGFSGPSGVAALARRGAEVFSAMEDLPVLLDDWRSGLRASVAPSVPEESK